MGRIECGCYWQNIMDLALAIYMFVVVNCDALAQASDFLIERRQIFLLCWMQNSNPDGLCNRFYSRLNARWQTDWAIKDQTKTWTRQHRRQDYILFLLCVHVFFYDFAYDHGNQLRFIAISTIAITLPLITEQEVKYFHSVVKEWRMSISRP